MTTIFRKLNTHIYPSLLSYCTVLFDCLDRFWLLYDKIHAILGHIFSMRISHNVEQIVLYNFPNATLIFFERFLISYGGKNTPGGIKISSCRITYFV